jgi:dTDP-4-amino-4,6-dideoxygalactose transaminase
MTNEQRMMNALAAQRTQALDALAVTTAQRDEAAEKAQAAFAALNGCILSGQVPQEDVPALIASVPGFDEWRAAQK